LPQKSIVTGRPLIVMGGGCGSRPCLGDASALSPAGRDAFAACLTEGTPGSCTTDLVGCIDRIRQ
jgi:hypothetical protein